jgi:hypothetical protein
MSEEKLTAKKFLESNGLPLSNISFIVYYDGFQRQPNLLNVMELYAELKIKEYQSNERH